MSDDYSVGSRPVTREPYRGARRRNRRTGEVQVWDGTRYVPEGSAALLTPSEQEQLSTARAAANQSAAMLPDLSRFEELNRTQPTGAIWDRVGNWLGLPPLAPDTEADEMRSITDRLAPRMRQPGSGASSDRDVAMFVSGLPNIARGGPANSNIISGIRRNVRRDQDYAAYLEWYGQQNRTLNGAQEGWNEYLQTPAARRRPWREHFGAGAPARRATTPRRPPGVPPTAQWDAARQRWVE